MAGSTVVAPRMDQINPPGYIERHRLMSGDQELIFSSRPGVAYVVESSAELETWAPFIPFLGASGCNETRLATTGSVEHRFFRVTQADD